MVRTGERDNRERNEMAYGEGELELLCPSKDVLERTIDQTLHFVKDL